MYYNTLNDLVTSTGYYKSFLALKMLIPNYTLSKMIKNPEKNTRNLQRLQTLLVKKLGLVTEKEFNATVENTIAQNKKRALQIQKEWESD